MDPREQVGIMERRDKFFQTRLWAQSQYGKGSGKQKELNEVNERSQLETGSRYFRWRTRHRSGESEPGEQDSTDGLQDGELFESVFPPVQNEAVKTTFSRKTDSPP